MSAFGTWSMGRDLNRIHSNHKKRAKKKKPKGKLTLKRLRATYNELTKGV
jgi:hypothetical protein